jgi:peptidyl-prolyl cis-trans isomerase SurA
MLKRLSLSLVLFAAPLAAQPARPASSQSIPLDRIVAIIGDQPITEFDVQERILQKQQQGLRLPSDTAALKQLERDVVNEIVDEELLTQKATELKVTVDDKDVTSTVDRRLKDIRAQFRSEQEFRTELAKAGLGTPEEYKRFLSEQLKRQQLLDRVVRKLREDGKIIPANVSEADVREAFEKNKEQMPPRLPSVTWRQIVINPKPSEQAKAIAKAKAESVLVQLKQGADFELIAKRESMDSTTRELGGDLGWQRMGVYVPEFERWVFGMYALPPGQLSPVVESPFGYHIIRVDRVRQGEVKARHILIRPVVDSAQVRKARLEADTVAAQLRANVSFDTLAKKHHDYANKEDTSILDPFVRDSLPPSYQTAFAGKKKDDIVVFPIGPQGGPPKFVVAQLLSVQEGGPRTLDEMREFVRNRLAEEGGMRRYLDSLRKQNYVDIRLDANNLAAKPQR